MLSANAASRSSQVAPGTKITMNGQTYMACNAKCTYHVSKNVQAKSPSSLIDGGCNGGLAGNDVKILEVTEQQVDVSGIADAKLDSIPVGTVAGLITSTEGPVIGIFHQYALYGKGNTIHSVIQHRSFGQDINDIPKGCKGGRQSIITLDGHTIPLAIREGLCYMDMRPLRITSWTHFPISL